MDWYNLKLGEEIQLDTSTQPLSAWVKRVPGGWIYTVAGNGGSVHVVFIPYDNEFQLLDSGFRSKHFTP